MSSSSAQLRKIKKPLIERRRRERINYSLNQLKNLVLEASDKDETRYSKMEKADILEMAVTYLRAIHCRRRPDVVISSPSGATTDRYKAGYRECAVHVGQYLVDVAGVGGLDAVRDQLMSHLNNALQTAVGDVDSCRRRQTDDEAAENSLWNGDCDDIGCCSADTDDDNSVCETTSDADVVRQECTVDGSLSSCAEPLGEVPTCHRSFPSRGDAVSPRNADEFPPHASFIPDNACGIRCSTPQASDVIDDVISRDVRKMAPDAVSCCNRITTDCIIATSSDVWRPW